MSIESKIKFVSLPQMFRQIGEVPQDVLDAGYDPATDEQVAAFGSVEDLQAWRSARGLSEEAYPIHTEGRMGIHIDIYTAANIAQLVPHGMLLTVREFFKGRTYHQDDSTTD